MAFLSSLVSWLVSNQAVLGGAVVAVVDLLIALNPNWQSSGILHALLSYFKPAA